MTSLAGQGLGEAFTDEVKEAWTVVYVVLASVMKDAMRAKVGHGDAYSSCEEIFTNILAGADSDTAGNTQGCRRYVGGHVRPMYSHFCCYILLL
jgi:hypothetical protein